jgi:ribosomal protein L40E
MDFLESLFDLGDRQRRKSGGFFQNGDHHDDDHDDEHNDAHNHHQQQYSTNLTQVPTMPVAALSGFVCRKCSTQTLQGANFCHGCGTSLEMILNCGSCGSRIPVNAPYCPQCGYKNG